MFVSNKTLFRAKIHKTIGVTYPAIAPNSLAVSAFPVAQIVGGYKLGLVNAKLPPTISWKAIPIRCGGIGGGLGFNGLSLSCSSKLPWTKTSVFCKRKKF